jgi:hypothetical protein
LAFRETLAQKKAQIVQRWLDEALSLYARDASDAFARQKNQFANPVGHSLRQGTLAIFEALLDGQDAEKIRQHLVEIVKIRAVQQFDPSTALDFIFRLKKIVREELELDLRVDKVSPEYWLFERAVDKVALDAFDVYVECREQVFELRSNEMKRRVSWIVGKLNKGETGPELLEADLNDESPRA